MKRIIILFTLIIALTSCDLNTKQEYYYIEIVEEKVLFGGPSEIKEKDKEIFEAENDSAAYIEAYKLFVIAKKVRVDMEESGMESVSIPVNFKLLNKNSDDITSVQFYKKKVFEEKIYKQIFSKENNLQQEDNKRLAENVKYIEGLAPVDVYLNLEKQGFKTNKQIGGDYGNMWTSTKSYAGIDYEVNVYSSDINNVESVSAKAMVDITQKDIIAVQQFLIYISSLPYDNASPQRAGQWVKANFNNDKAAITIGDAKFTLYAPSAVMRMLVVEKSK